MTLSPHDYDTLGGPSPWGGWWRWDALARGYYVNDRRLQFTGQEATFGVEGVLAGVLRQDAGDWELGIESELYLNQPFDRNRLRDEPERASYLGNFDDDPLEISQLLLTPQDQLGDPVHDVTTRRGLAKLICHVNAHCDAYTGLIVENDVPHAQAGRLRQGAMLLLGCQAGF